MTDVLRCHYQPVLSHWKKQILKNHSLLSNRQLQKIFESTKLLFNWLILNSIWKKFRMTYCNFMLKNKTISYVYYLCIFSSQTLVKDSILPNFIEVFRFIQEYSSQSLWSCVYSGIYIHWRNKIKKHIFPQILTVNNPLKRFQNTMLLMSLGYWLELQKSIVEMRFLWWKIKLIWFQVVNWF